MLHYTTVSAPFVKDTTSPRDSKGIIIDLFYINIDLPFSSKETMGSALRDTGSIANTQTQM